MKKLTSIKTGMLCVFICMVFLGCGAKNSPEYYSALSESEPAAEGTENTADDYDSSEAQASVQDICVYVCGEVLNPGVYTLKAGDRVCDAIELAGGFTDRAADEYLNQAELVTDSQKLYVPSEDEAAEMQKGGVSSVDGNAQMADTGGDGRININTASVSELTTITGIGETRAKAIVDYRTEHGSFNDTKDITNVSGIGDATYEKIKESICVN